MTTPPPTSLASADREALLDKLGRVRRELRAAFVERDAAIDGMLAAMLAGEHVLLLGPVGTAKSLLATSLCERLCGATHFGWLLTRFTTPEELFGPVSLRGLEADEVRRVTQGKLPTAHIAFLDEVFKASSAILNALLGLMNERVFHNAGRAEPVPLVTLVAASNELPEEGELAALFDRFLVRFVVDYIQEDFRFLKMLTLPAPEPGAGTRLELAELEALRALAADVALDERLLGDVVELRRRLAARNIIASDRRYRRALGLVRAYALLDGRQQVSEADLQEALSHVLWDDPAQREELRATLHEVFRGHEEDARRLQAQAHEVRDWALRPRDDAELAMRASIEAHTKLKNLMMAAERLLEEVRSRGRHAPQVEQLVEELRDIQREILERSLQV